MTRPKNWRNWISYVRKNMLNLALQSLRFSATGGLREGVVALQHARIETASLDARLLLEYVLGVSREELLAGDDWPLTPELVARYRQLIEKRARRQPLA